MTKSVRKFAELRTVAHSRPSSCIATIKTTESKVPIDDKRGAVAVWARFDGTELAPDV